MGEPQRYYGVSVAHSDARRVLALLVTLVSKQFKVRCKRYRHTTNHRIMTENHPGLAKLFQIVLYQEINMETLYQI
jgi:hypothetical protein